MATAFLDISTDLLASLCQGLKQGEKPRFYRVSKNPIPESATVVGVSSTEQGRTIRIALESCDFVEGEKLPPVWLDAVESAAMDKLAAAYFLAKGSYGTAKDNGIVLENSDPAMSDEMKHLAANFLRISELLVEAGFKP